MEFTSLVPSICKFHLPLSNLFFVFLHFMICSPEQLLNVCEGLRRTTFRRSIHQCYPLAESPSNIVAAFTSLLPASDNTALGLAQGGIKACLARDPSLTGKRDQFLGAK